MKCGLEKPIGEFYRHKGMADGHLNKCKDCARCDVKTNRVENIDRVREYDRSRANLPHRVECRKNYLKTDSGKKSSAKAKARWIDNNPEKRKAHLRLEAAKKSGKVVVPVTCERCGLQLAIEAHHDDYSKPLDVNWLCDGCHKKVHNIERENERKTRK